MIIPLPFSLPDRNITMFLLSVCSLFLFNFIVVQSELFTSTTHLTQLLNTEVELSKQLETYLTEEYQRLEHVEK